MGTARPGASGRIAASQDTATNGRRLPPAPLPKLADRSVQRRKAGKDTVLGLAAKFLDTSAARKNSLQQWIVVNDINWPRMFEARLVHAVNELSQRGLRQRIE